MQVLVILIYKDLKTLHKVFMYKFHYNYIKRKLSPDLLFTDTYILIDGIETEDVHEDFNGDENLFDFSDYSQDSELFYSVNKKLTGKMKYELKEKLINELVRLKSKMYFLFSVNQGEIKKAKGVNKNVVKNAKHNDIQMFHIVKKKTKWQGMK